MQRRVCGQGGAGGVWRGADYMRIIIWLKATNLALLPFPSIIAILIIYCEFWPDQ